MIFILPVEPSVRAMKIPRCARNDPCLQCYRRTTYDLRLRSEAFERDTRQPNGTSWVRRRCEVLNREQLIACQELQRPVEPELHVVPRTVQRVGFLAIGVARHRRDQLADST